MEGLLKNASFHSRLSTPNSRLAEKKGAKYYKSLRGKTTQLITT
jgi:hypothetical protein